MPLRLPPPATSTRPRIAALDSHASVDRRSAIDTADASTCTSILSSSGPLTRARYRSICVGVQRQRRRESPKCPHGHECVAFLLPHRFGPENHHDHVFPGKNRVPGASTDLGRAHSEVRKCRLDMGLEQEEVAKLIGVTESTIWGWEKTGRTPQAQRIPAIVAFLRYHPFPRPETIPELLVWHRKAHGWTGAQFAGILGVDPASLSSWERGEHVPTGKSLDRIQKVLGRL